MPPRRKDAKKKKKGEEEEESTDYNLAIMSIDDLKNYAHMLEKGIEEMRKHCSFYQMAETELTSFVENRQKELAKLKEALMAKDIKVESLRSKVEQKNLQKSDSLMYNEYGCAELEKKLHSRTMEQLDNLANEHKEAQLAMKGELLQKERELEILSKKTEITKRDARESMHKKLLEKSAYEKQLMDKCKKELVQVNADSNLETNLFLKSIEAEALEGKRITEKEFFNACLSYKDELQEYFKNVTRTDLATIKGLKERIKELEIGIAHNTLIYEEIQKQNAELKAKTPRYTDVNVTGEVSSNKCLKNIITDIHTLKKAQKYLVENETLEKEIQKVERECNKLRDQFTLALSEIRESANIKAEILEQKLEQLLDATNKKSKDYKKLVKTGILKTRAIQEYSDILKTKF